MEPDALIFDMDGTLWDATESYSAIWKACMSEFGFDCEVSASELIEYMGLTMDKIISNVSARHGVEINIPSFMSRIGELEDDMMPQLGGTLYEGVADGIKQLSNCYRLYLLSNCSRLGLHNFMRCNDLERYITATISHGERNAPKSENLKYLMEREHLSTPVYIGDTQSDCNETRKAGIPFVYVSYGFGSCDSCELQFDSFGELTRYFLEKK